LWFKQANAFAVTVHPRVARFIAAQRVAIRPSKKVCDAQEIAKLCQVAPLTFLC
jgi:hypothetical protein